MTSNLYARLKLTRNATPDEIRRAFRKLAAPHHPDRHLADGEAKRAKAAEKFAALAEAHEVLIDPERRAAYDANGSVKFRPVSADLAEAMSVLTPILASCVEQLAEQGAKFDEQDMHAHLTEGVRQSKANLEKMRAKCVKVRDGLKVTAARFETDEPDNALAACLRQHLQAVENTLKQHEECLGHIGKAQILLKKYRYRFIARMQTGGFAASAAMTSSRIWLT